MSIKPVGKTRTSREAVEQDLLRARQRTSRESAVLVAVEFTSDRFRPSSVAQQARAAAAIMGQGPVVNDHLDQTAEIPQTLAESPVDLDFDASLAEFQELARSAGATIAAVLIQRRWWAAESSMRSSLRLPQPVRALCFSTTI